MNPPWRYLQLPAPGYSPDGESLSVDERLVLAVTWAKMREAGGPVVALGTYDVAERAGCSRSAAQRARDSLVERGVLLVVCPGRLGRMNAGTYRLSETPTVGGKAAKPKRPPRAVKVRSNAQGGHLTAQGGHLSRRERGPSAAVAAPAFVE